MNNEINNSQLNNIPNHQVNDNENLINKINELEERVTKLEKIEKKRKIRAIISLIIRLLIYIATIIALIYAWNNIYNSIIKPYNETIDEVNGIKDKTTSKIEKYTDIFNKR